MGMREPPHIQKYFSEFFNIYTGIGEWHQVLMEGVIRDKTVTLPSGRQYYWPDAQRRPGGGCTYATNVKNYPVQGHATADVVPISIITIDQELKKRGLKALLINSVHDSVVLDCPEDEVDEVMGILFDKMINVAKEFFRRYGYQFTVPLNCEIKVGVNWLEGKEFKFKEWAQKRAA
jgi:DNA polymerase-1